jgi:molybdopterin synthase catalytic subunit
MTGAKVLELEYEAYPEMAGQVLRRSWRSRAAMARLRGSRRAPCRRRADQGGGGAIVTAAPHRSVAYEANQFVIDAIKDRLPIWKRGASPTAASGSAPGA